MLLTWWIAAIAGATDTCVDGDLVTSVESSTLQAGDDVPTGCGLVPGLDRAWQIEVACTDGV
jgi:hypothetical protein